MEYKRLTVTLPNGENRVTETKFNSIVAMQKAVDRLAELEDKIENGTLVELPCKLNDIVYVIPTSSNGFEHITKCVCLGFQISEPKYVADLFRKENGKSHLMYQASFEMFGKTVFLTKEEAESKLKEWKEREHKIPQEKE